MILGVGVDLCHIVRIRRSIGRFGKSWLDEVFTEHEQEELGTGDQRAHRAAIGFAVKEACSKAIATGFASGVRRQDFVTTLGDGHCSVALNGNANRRARQLCSIAASPILRAHWRSSESWVSALAVLALEGDELRIIRDHLCVPQVHRSPSAPGR